jgi:hypothetical protein
MIEYASKVTIGRPAQTVYPYIAEPEKQALWSGVPMRQLTPGPLQEGSQIELTFGMGPMKARLVLEFTAMEPDRRTAWKTISGPIRWDGEYRLAPDGAGTAVSQQGRLRFTGLWRLVEPIVGAEIRSGEVKELEKLKAVVEAA